jgi:hypothetical protein
MSTRIDEPSGVEDIHVTKDIDDEERVEETLIPKIPWNQGRTNEGKDKVQIEVILVLKSNDGIIHEVIKVQLLCLENYFRMFPSQEPTNMSKEESSMSVVRIGIRLSKLVVNQVISDPDFKGILSCDAVTDHEEDSKGKSCVVRLVRPVTMSPCSHTEGRVHSDDISPHDIVRHFEIQVCHHDKDGVSVKEAPKGENACIEPNNIKVSVSDVDERILGSLDDVFIFSLNPCLLITLIWSQRFHSIRIKEFLGFWDFMNYGRSQVN